MTIELANRLAELRKQKGLSQEELADRLGVSRQAISKWERGEASPDTDNLIELAKIYEISLDELVGLSNPNKSNDNKDEPKKAGIHIENDDEDSIHIDDEGIHITDDEGNKVEITGHKIRLMDKDGFCKVIHRHRRTMIFISSIVTLLVVVAYLLLGFLLKLWDKAWVLFLLPVIIPSIFEAIALKNIKKFSFTPTIVFIYFLLCCWIFDFSLWHPLWVMFLSIPIYYTIINFIKHSSVDDHIIVTPEEAEEPELK